MIELNSREWAILIWLAALIAFIIAKPKIRSSGASLIRSFFQWKIQASLIAALFWSAGCIWILWRLGLWQWGNLKTTIVWGFTFMFVTLIDAATSKDGVRTLRELARQAITVAVVVGFIAEFYTMPLWAELLLVPALALLGGMVALAEIKSEYSRLLSPLTSVQVLAGLGLLVFSIYQIATHWSEFATLGTAYEFTVPILLSFMYLPFLYGYLVLIAYENASVRLHFTIPDKALRRPAYFRGMLAFGPNLELFKRYIRALNATDTLDRKRIKEAISEVRRIRRREKRLPTVDWSKGWSPYDAQDFLATQELRTNDYHRAYSDWCAESSAVEIGGTFLKDRLTYRISGNEAATTKLDLELNAHVPGQPELADEHFHTAADLMITRALGDEAAGRYIAERIGKVEGELDAGRFKIQWRHDRWGTAEYGGYCRRLSIHHPAHLEAFTELSDDQANTN
jgi:hypothetical protein